MGVWQLLFCMMFRFIVTKFVVLLDIDVLTLVMGSR